VWVILRNDDGYCFLTHCRGAESAEAHGDFFVSLWLVRPSAIDSLLPILRQVMNYSMVEILLLVPILK
jgi:hypothetical protein